MARMAVYYPDVSSAQRGMSLAGAAAVCVKISEGTGYVNPYLGEFRQAADKAGAFAFGYHFLHAGNAEAQAVNCKTANPAGLAVMVDCEYAGGSYPSLGDLVAFTDEYRRLGGICWLAYLPRWYWSGPLTDGGMGSPSLAKLTARGMSLVSSDYPGFYSDNGPGWMPYGGMRPAIWQYTDHADIDGQLVDRNAYKGTLAQLQRLVTTGSAAAPPAQEEDDDMMLETGDGAETIHTFTRGSRSWVSFGCNASRTHSPAPKLRVAVHSNGKGWSQVIELVMPLSGKAGVNFTAHDADMISVVRQAGDEGDNVAVGFNLG